MMRIVIYELIKIFRKKSIIIALLVFSLINIYKVNDCFNRSGKADSAVYQGYWKAYENASGKITESKINFVINGYKNSKKIVDAGNFSTNPNQPNTYTGYIFGDMNMFKELYDSLDYSYNYERSLDNVISKARQNIQFFKNHKNAFEVKSNRNIVNVYANRSISEFYNTEGYEEFFKYNFSSLLIILLLILGLAPVFSSEKETGMHVMQSTCKYGKTATVSAKIFSSALYIIIICVWFFLLDYICFSVFFKLLGHGLPVYAMQSYQFTPFTMKIWEFVIFLDCIKLIVFLSLGVIILLFSSVFSESLLPFAFSAGAIFICLGSNDFGSYKLRELLSVINPLSLLSSRKPFQKYEVVNLFGEPIFQYTAILIYLILLSAVITFFIVLVNRKNIFIPRIKHTLYLRLMKKDTAYENINL